ncbi:ABC transporter ATP-binding protein [Thermoanaerobacterium thermosaccharolyticum]|uniref:ABC transporter ATP-binding protein n=1 Tax=Thermoanaerobacterium thermosaccharolyticum TaxID=1517 RepID=UPI00123A7464|nr:ABC transporter ATP-binding protein [Thermoanaerobacterium thermosaccharolyticum]KAA5806621.1 ABC transporter ATP-binding protein [Thermoanaerobacterium thermosaccharolyticum]
MKKDEFRHVYSIIKPYMIKEIIGFFIIIISTIISLSNPYIIKLIIDIAIANKDVHDLIRYIIIFVVIYIVGTILNIIQSYIFTYIGEKMLYDLRLNLYKSVMNKEITFFNEKQTGEIMARILNELPDVVNLFAGTFINIITQVATLIIAFVIMFTINRDITIISLLVTPMIYIVLRYYNPIFRNINLKFMQINSKISNVLQENIFNIKIIKYLKAYKFAQRRFSFVLHEYINKRFDSVYINSISNTLLSFLFFIPSLILLLYGGYQVIQGRLTIGGIVALSAYINQLFQPIKSLSNINIDLQKSKVALKRYLEIVGKDKKEKTDDIKMSKIKNCITLENVTFSYQKDNSIINNLSLKLEIGKIIRISGANGKGKTTLIDIICGLLTPQSGVVKFDDIDIKNINIYSLKKLIGIVPQNTYLFNDTIKGNIKMGRDIDDNRTITLCEKLGFNDLINDKILNLSSIISNNGDSLSGGQKRKITILRALVHDPQIIILDESLTFLDDYSKENFCKYLDQIKKDKIIIMISHEDTPYLDIDLNINVENSQN